MATRSGQSGASPKLGSGHPLPWPAPYFNTVADDVHATLDFYPSAGLTTMHDQPFMTSHSRLITTADRQSFGREIGRSAIRKICRSWMPLYTVHDRSVEWLPT